LKELVTKIKGAIFPSNVAMNIYKQFRKKGIHPVAKFRGELEISPELAIQIVAYGKTRAENLPSLKKFSLVAAECISLSFFYFSSFKRSRRKGENG
jgi:hypothetical protein